MLKRVIERIKERIKIAKCNICDKEFDKKLPGTFRSDKRLGPVVYFCPQCNKDLVCNFCGKSAEKSFDIYSGRGKGGTERHRDVLIICESCLQKRLGCVYRRVQDRCPGRLPTMDEIREGVKEATEILREMEAKRDAGTGKDRCGNI